MAHLKALGDTAELAVAHDLLRRGYGVAFPYGEDWDYDLIVCRGEKLERVQVKYTRSDGVVIAVRSRSASLTNGKVKSYKYYTSQTIDWMAVYDATTDKCYYLPASILGGGMSMLHLRLTEARNNQRVGVRYARDYVDF